MSWRWAGDQAVLRGFDDPDIVVANASVRALYRYLHEIDHEDVVDIVPGARTLMVLLRPAAEVTGDLLEALEAGGDPSEGFGEARTVEIPVTYGGDAGPDLDVLADSCSMTPDEVVELHSSQTYTVGFIGFTPGFAYLLGLPEGLATPRLPTPRMKVPAGSVGIGGSFTGVYPRETPGGWHLIGRTATELFDATKDPPSMLLPGDHVRFVKTS